MTTDELRTYARESGWVLYTKARYPYKYRLSKGHGQNMYATDEEKAKYLIDCSRASDIRKDIYTKLYKLPEVDLLVVKAFVDKYFEGDAN